MRFRLRHALWCAAALAAVWVLRGAGAQSVLRGALERVEASGPWGPAAFIAVYFLSSVAFVPAAPLTVGAGVLFGLWPGTLWVVLSSIAAAAASFLIARFAARERVERAIREDSRFRTLERAVSRSGWRAAALIRFSPLFPFTAVNFGFGLTRIGFAEFLAATAVGILPGTLLEVYLGCLAGGLAGIGAAARPQGPLAWALAAAGLSAAAGVAVLLGREVRRLDEAR